MLPRTKLKKLLTVLAISVNFKQVVGKFCLNIWLLGLGVLRESERHKRIFRAGQRSWL